MNCIPHAPLRYCISCLIFFSLAGCGSPPAVDRVIDMEPAEARHAEEMNHVESKKTVVESVGASPFLRELGIELARVESGRFQMGNADPARFGTFSECEGPQHPVVISKDLLITKHEITVGQFRTFVSETGYVTEGEESQLGCNGLDVDSGNVVRNPDCIWSSPGFPQMDDHPVVCVSWHDALSFCHWLTSKTGQTFRLPTEAEWEYCCRAGSDRLFATGDDPHSIRHDANCGDQSLKTLCPSLTSSANWDDGYAFTAPVASFQPNAFGLYDMHGNVGEWCLDWFEADYYAKSPENDPQGPDNAETWRVVRGGSWYNNPFGCRASGRHDGVPTEASTTNGFRIVAEIPTDE